MEEQSISLPNDIRENIDAKFKPLFDRYENEGGMPVIILIHELYQSSLPRPHVTRFIRKADRNFDGRISYDEFLREMSLTDTLTRNKLLIHKRILNHAVRAVAPDKAKKNRTKNFGEDVDLYNWGEKDVNNYLEAYDCKPPPIFIPLMSLALVAVYLYYAIANPNLNVTWNQGVDFSSVLIWNPKRRIELWRYVSYSLLHNGYLHLIFNLIVLLFLGTLLELVHKFWRVGLVFILGVFAGSLTHSMFDAKTYLAGASGGCYALLGAHCATIIVNWEEMQRGWLSSPFYFLSSAVFRLILIILIGGSDTGASVYNRIWNASANAQIGFSAHAGGFLAGICIGIPILRNMDVKTWEKVLFWICIVTFFLFVIAAFLMNYFCVDLGSCYPMLGP